MRLDELLDGMDVRATTGDLGVDVRSVTLDSHAVEPGALFCAVPGRIRDGHDFATDAVGRGAVAVLGERLTDAPAPHVVVGAARPAMAAVAAALNGHPSHAIAVIGVTGTNGKTTTTHLLRAVLDAAGRPCGVIGSLGGARTTPEAPALQAELARLRDSGHAAAAMEVSSAALVAHRVDAIHFAASVFTNLGRDHLGEVHPTMEDYYAAKASLFVPELTAVGVVNRDDEWGRRLIDAAPVPIVAFSIDDASDVELDRRASAFRWRGERIELPLPGRFNIANAIAAATTAAELGVAPGTIAAGLAQVSPVPGHFEWVEAGQPFAVAVDYAHTPEALEQALIAARDVVAGGRVIVVFGCGGDRDPGKRAPMGKAAATLADLTVVTSDNPRHEDPGAIIDAVLAGAPASDGVVVEPDRAAAIRVALEAAAPGDLVVIAGKGHESGQQIGDTVLPFDDHAVALELLRQGA